MKYPFATATAALLIGLPGLVLAGSPTNPPPAQLAAALRSHLAQQGHLCLGKFDWPIDVNAVDFANRTRDALQMPVLESLGLVSSSDGTVTMHKQDGGEEQVPAKRYELTRVGKMFYLPRESTSAVGGQQVQHHNDLCAGKLTLDKLVSWSSSTEGGSPQAVVNYTYRFTPAQWARFPEALKVFPVVARIDQGQGQLQMTQRFQQVHGTWVAVGL